MAKVTAPTGPPAPTGPSLVSALVAEAFGTFLLVFGVLGAAVLTGDPLKVALAAGLAVTIGIYSVGHLSGAHFNPAVTIGLAIAGRFRWSRVWQYVVAQLIGGIVASSVLFLIATGGKDGFAKSAVADGFASNGFAEHSPDGFSLLAVIIVEVVLTAVLLLVIMSVTDVRHVGVLAPLIIGATLTLIHVIAIPVSNASVNPARSIASAIFGGPDAMAQLIVFVLAPVFGAVVAGLSYRVLFARDHVA